MFRDVGRMLKLAGKLLFYVGIGFSVLYGLFSLLDGWLTGIIIMLIGPAFAWVASLVVYGIGEMIENSDIQTEIMLKEAKRKEKSETEY